MCVGGLKLCGSSYAILGQAQPPSLTAKETELETKLETLLETEKGRVRKEPAAGAVDEDGAELSVCLTHQVQVATHTHTHVSWLSRVHNSDTKSATKSLISAKKMT